MTASELVKRLGAQILNNKVRHPETGVVVARFEGADLVLTPEGEIAAASLPVKTPRAKAAPAVESAPEAPEQIAQAAAPEAPAE
jgi:hypothetical protein